MLQGDEKYTKFMIAKVRVIYLEGGKAPRHNFYVHGQFTEVHGYFFVKRFTGTCKIHGHFLEKKLTGNF